MAPRLPSRPRHNRPPLPQPGLPQGWRPQAPGAPGAPGAPAAPAAPAVDPYDYSADPILQQIKALGAQRMADAQAAAIRARATETSDYGDVQARLGREQVEKPRELTENLNKGNLFYSSEFGKQQTSLSRALAENAAGEQRRHQERLAGIDQGVLGVEREVQGEGISAEEAAAERLRERLGDTQYGIPTGGHKPIPGIGGGVKSALAKRLRGKPAPQRPKPGQPPGWRP